MLKKLIFTLSAIMSMSAHAIQITPPNNLLTQESRFLSAKLSVNKKSPVIIEAKKVVGFNEEGIDILEDTDEVSVFPKQIMIDPSQSRSLTIKYNGTYDDNKEHHYRIIARTVSLNDGISKTGIEIQRAFHANLFVSPNNPTSRIEISDIKIDGSELTYNVSNTGNFNTLIREAKIYLADSETGEIVNLDMKEGAGKNIYYKRYYPETPITITSDLSEVDGFNPNREYEVTITGVESRCLESEQRCKGFRFSNGE